MAEQVDLDRLEHAVRLYLDLEHPEAWEALAEIVAQAREAERLRENKTCRQCGWSGAPYMVLCPACFDGIDEATKIIRDLRTRLAEVERERQAVESRALRENSRADAQTARGDAIQEHAASLVTRIETLTSALERYGRHVRGTCHLTRYEHPDEDCVGCVGCTCGFDQARGGG